MAHWYGTVAAARELGARGIEVDICASSPLHQARWSRHVAKTLRCPEVRDPDRYLAWLLKTGARKPGTALCATSDDLCFLFARHADELRKVFRVAPKPLPVLRELLDKSRLHRNAEAVGIAVPQTHFPDDLAEAERVAKLPSTRYPLLLKQRAQVYSATQTKGTIVERSADLPAAYERFCRQNTFDRMVTDAWPDVGHAALQEYLPEASKEIYCLAGFLAPAGNRFALRAARKLLSHPRYLGVGLLFEHAEVDPDLGAKLIELCRTIGYVGLFQCEFLVHEGKPLLIDFNPRFYNYMAFDHARGLPQAYLQYLLAIGDHAEIDRVLEQSQQVPEEKKRLVYAHRVATWVQLHLERLVGNVGADELEHWREWRSKAVSVIDPIWDPADPRPGYADLLLRIWTAARHPRYFLRSNTRKAV